MKVTYLPIEQFLQLTQSNHHQPDPVPRGLLWAVLLFVSTAVFVL